MFIHANAEIERRRPLQNLRAVFVPYLLQHSQANLTDVGFTVSHVPAVTT